MSDERRKITTYNSETELIDGLSQLIESLAVDAISKNGCFRVGLSGGSLVNYMAKLKLSPKANTKKWTFFFCDERVVPEEDQDSTYGTYKREMVEKTPGEDVWSLDQFVKIDPSLPAKEAAEDYEKKMKEVFGSEVIFDLLLLGLGPDGHTCSLFPGHLLLAESKLWVAPITDSPKPPPSRVTLTLPVVNNARNCVFVATGKGKADVIKEIIKFDKPLPANLVRPTDGCVYWLLDSEASKKIQG